MDLRAIGMGLAFAFMWSSAFSSARMIVAEAPPLYALAVRFVISGLLGVGIAALAGQSFSVIRSQWRPIVIFGLCQNALYLGLNFVAMQRVEASLAAIIASTMPLLVAALGWAAFGERVRPLGLVGLLAGVLGVAIIMGGRLSGDLPLGGVALCGLGALALAIATLTVRGASAGGNLMMIVGLQMFVGAVPLAILAVLTETWEVSYSPRLALAFAYTTLVPGLMATWVWFRLVGRIGAVRAATYHFLNPIVGVAVAWALLGEELRTADLIGVAVVAAGILAVQMAKVPAATGARPVVAGAAPEGSGGAG